MQLDFNLGRIKFKGGRFNDLAGVYNSSQHLVKGFKDSDLIFSMPYYQMRSIVEGIPLSSARIPVEKTIGGAKLK